MLLNPVVSRSAAAIPRFSPGVPPETLASAVREAGCAIVERAAVKACENARSELEPYLSRVPYCSGSFTGKRTRRTMRLVHKSRATHQIILNDLIQDTLSILFRGEAYHHQLHFTEAVRIEPGETAQSLHRDDNTFPFLHPCPPAVINTVWALDDFTSTNGATRVIPRSQLWDDERKPDEAEAITATMTKGSALIFDGGLYHGGGKNRSALPRTALLLAYSLGWLRPAENPQLAVPPAQAKRLPKRLQDLLGYRTHGFLGSFEGVQPSACFFEPLPDVLPAEDLYGPELEQMRVRRR